MSQCIGRVIWDEQGGFHLRCDGQCENGADCAARRIRDPQTGAIREFCSCHGDEPPSYCHLEIVWDPQIGCHCVRCVGQCDNAELSCTLEVRRLGEFVFEYSCRCTDQKAG